MEIRIKDTNGYVDADWTIENGVMIVSPKEEKFEPKDGDVVVCSNGKYIQLFICKNFVNERQCYCYCFYNEEDSSISTLNIGYIVERPATEEEKQKLFAKLAEEGWEWNSEKKELVKLKWKPKVDEKFYYPSYRGAGVFKTDDCTYTVQSFLDEDTEVQNGWCFKTEAECQAFCDRLNEAINQVKP